MCVLVALLAMLRSRSFALLETLLDSSMTLSRELSRSFTLAESSIPPCACGLLEGAEPELPSDPSREPSVPVPEVDGVSLSEGASNVDDVEVPSSFTASIGLGLPVLNQMINQVTSPKINSKIAPMIAHALPEKPPRGRGMKSSSASSSLEA